MTICSNTSLTIPECCCAQCIERQLAEFAPRDEAQPQIGQGLEPEREYSSAAR